MNILFLTLLDFDTLEDRNIYTDLLREFRKHGHTVYVISPVERRRHVETHLIKENGSTILKPKIGNTQKTNLIEKGISTLQIEPQLIKAIKKYFSEVKFDLVLYSTPPITFCKAIEYVKKRDNAKTYLLLKDIFPQNAVDLGILSKTGLKGFLYRYFRHKEKTLYAISDRIGCMSQANVDYVLKHNPEISGDKVEVCPNCIEPRDLRLSDDEKKKMREKYDIPLNKKVFVYGGNLGKPQGIPFIIECLKKMENHPDAYFLVVGDGTEYGKLESYFKESKPQNIKLMQLLPKDDYDRMIATCDVGLIFLDYRFTIPNFPSRLLSYMQAGLPVLACTDKNTDIGRMIEKGGFGWWCESTDTAHFKQIIDMIVKISIKEKGENGYSFLLAEYNAEQQFRRIILGDK